MTYYEKSVDGLAIGRNKNLINLTLSNCKILSTDEVVSIIYIITVLFQRYKQSRFIILYYYVLCITPYIARTSYIL